MILLEDLHWFDGASDAFLETTVESLPATHDLMLLNFRPEYQARWMQRSYYQQLPLPPLGPEAIRALLRDHLGDDPGVAALPETIHQRTKGNPFFIEELATRWARRSSATARARRWFTHARAAALMYLGRLEEAWGQSREAERVAEESQDLEMLGSLLCARALLAYACGGTESILNDARRSLEIAEKLDNESSRMLAYLALGFAHLIKAQLALARAVLATEDVLPRAAIESALERAEHLVESIDGRSLSPRIIELRGRLATALGDATASGRLLRDALDLYRAIGATGHAQRLAKEIGA